MNEPNLQNVDKDPIEARRLRDLLLDKPGEQPLIEADYAALERRAQREANAIDDAVMATAAKRQIPQPQPKNGVIIDLLRVYVRTGATQLSVAPGYLGLQRSRREIVVERVGALGFKKVVMLRQYRDAVQKYGDGYRKQRRAVDALKSKILKFLPEGITLEEALAVLP